MASCFLGASECKSSAPQFCLMVSVFARWRIFNINGNIPWNVVFIVSLWNIWLARNRMSFNNLDTSLTTITKAVTTYAKEIHEAFESLSQSSSFTGRLIPWRLPTAGSLKMNVHGCFYDHNKRAGIGGAIRDDKGNWIYGFYGKMECNNSLEAELWAVYRGLSVLVEKGLNSVYIESDSSLAVAYCQEESVPNHPLRYIIEETRRLLTRMQATIMHVYREANQTADCLARLGSQQEQDLVVTTSIPMAAREFALADLIGTDRCVALV